MEGDVHQVSELPTPAQHSHAQQIGKNIARENRLGEDSVIEHEIGIGHNGLHKIYRSSSLGVVETPSDSSQLSLARN